MTRQIESVVVLGSGLMGSGIAVISAAAGCRVLMLDMTAEAAEQGAASIEQEHRHLVTTGSFDDDLSKVADYDWICEVIVEDLAAKRALFERVEQVRSDGSMISSNTSGIPLRDICAGFGDRFRSDIVITHFFNPVSVMKLVELVPGDDTDPEVIEAFTTFGTERLGKGVVHAKDTVNFIGNRIGCFFMLSGLHKAKPYLAEGMTQETIDGVLAAPLGLPRTGLYGLIDLIGLDVMDLVGKNLAANLAAGDVGAAFTEFPPAEQRMLERGQLGRKTRAGFARLTKLDDGSRHKETFDLVSEAWRDTVGPDIESISGELGEVMFDDCPQGLMAWDIFGGTLRYAAGLVPEIADDVASIDNAMRWGFNWEKGPFEFLDAIGPDRVIARIEAEGGGVPAMLAVLRDSGASSFYSEDGSEFLGLDGECHN